MGRYSNARRAEIAAEAAAKATQAAQTAQVAPELPLESGSDKPPDKATRPEGVRPPLRNEPRRLAMEEIEALDLERKGLTPETPPATPEAVKPEPIPAPQVTAPETPVAPIAAAAEPIKTVKVKVDGQEFDAPQADVDAAGGISAYQRDKASENRLAKANQTLAETRQVQAYIAQLVQQLAPKQPTETDAQFIASKMDMIRFGTPEESAVALQEVLSRSAQKIDPQAITQQAVSTMQRNLALDSFKKEFQDVVTHPMLLRLAVSLENERISKTGQPADWASFYSTIGNEVRSVTGRQSQPATALAAPAATTSDTPSPASDKEARKASIVNVPTAAARAELPTEPKPETREDILNQMRKSRGLPVG